MDKGFKVINFFGNEKGKGKIETYYTDFFQVVNKIRLDLDTFWRAEDGIIFAVEKVNKKFNDLIIVVTYEKPIKDLADKMIKQSEKLTGYKIIRKEVDKL